MPEKKKINDQKKFWIVIGDIHGDTQNLNKIPDLADAEGLIISGDLTNEGGKNQAKEIIDQLSLPHIPILAQIGNMDLQEVDQLLERNNINLHRHERELTPEIAIFGVGGSTPTPMNTPTEFSESEYASWLKKEWEKAKDCPLTVLISHNPPKNTNCDIVGNGIHVGSSAVRDFIEEAQPDICICGHIHESKGVDKIGKTQIINPGAFTDGGYVKLIFKDGQLFCELEQIRL